MKQYTHFIIYTFYLLSYLCGSAFAQNTKAQIKNVAFELINDNLVVSYDIVKYKPAEKFKVRLNVYTALENKIEARSLSGDINDNVSGGERKKIVWDMRKDSIFLDNDIYVEVIASPQPEVKTKGIETPAVPGKPVEPAVVPVPPVTTKAKTGKSVKMGKALLFSTIYPGWGDHYVKPNNAFWIIGAGAYGLAAWSVVSNRSASSSYSDYLVSTQTDSRNDLYSDAVKKKRVSTFAISAAAAIWIADLAWVLVKSKKNSKEHAAIIKNGVSLGFGYGYNPEINKTILSVNVTF